MTQSPSTLNPTILEPLFAPWAEPNAHRVRAEKAGDPAVIVQGRRASPIDLVSNLRSAVRDWREAFYIGASDTTIQLLNHWFGRAHRQTTASSEDFEFRYYFCQTEAIDRAPDVAAFAKNAGSQCLRVDYLANGDRRAFYTPDFFIRTIDNHYYLVETKGREDRDVPLKAKAAIAWCEAASTETLLTGDRWGVGLFCNR